MLIYLDFRQFKQEMNSGLEERSNVITELALHKLLK
jgi:hypothetical protein